MKTAVREHRHGGEHLQPIRTLVHERVGPDGDDGLRGRIERLDDRFVERDRKGRHVDQEDQQEAEQTRHEDAGAELIGVQDRSEVAEKPPAAGRHVALDRGELRAVRAVLDAHEAVVAPTDRQQTVVQARSREGGDDHVGHRENPDVSNRAPQLGGHDAGEDRDHERHARPHVLHDEGEPERYVVVVGDDDDGVDLVVERPPDGAVVRIAEVGDLRARRVERALGDLRHLVMADEEDVLSASRLSRLAVFHGA